VIKRSELKRWLRHFVYHVEFDEPMAKFEFNSDKSLAYVSPASNDV